jgi:hypothetical protein
MKDKSDSNPTQSRRGGCYNQMCESSIFVRRTRPFTDRLKFLEA